ncbi:hypothetical protein LTR62_008691 [Meristemomyces frigidus]|uniref:RBR-type E3 ubiquitin transferase n=1 Tax=Meristemomyces frigidus TaxID=1508187 RepID=A0AAN7YH00_9PEZI|nr:hypothetical protein LTR62_008691 [Meristemomyces frigidus]
MEDTDERVEELQTLAAIYPEMVIDYEQLSATLELAVTPTTPLLIRFVPEKAAQRGESYAQAAVSAHVERDVRLSHLPTLKLEMSLPSTYPADAPPKMHLTTGNDWLPKKKLVDLAEGSARLWEEYGGCQILFAYIDFLQQAAERGFDLDQTSEGCLVLPEMKEKLLVAFDKATELAIFNEGHYDCGICLEPKKGLACYKMKRCGHVFCLQCLQDFYNNAITEGDVAGVTCLDPTCGKETNANGRKRKRKSDRTLNPRELLAMHIDEPKVRRYVEMKRKKKLEADKSTVYCPRSWCQGPAKSAKYPPLPADLTTYPVDDGEESASSESEPDSLSSKHDSARSITEPPNPGDRLAICEKCTLAFCKVCFMGWHGDFLRCRPRDPSQLSAEEKASYDYIRLHTSPCPTCSSPTQKTMGCNHMNCFQCGTHFCYLCSAWLMPDNPYIHYNSLGTDCYQRLWELEEGDNGQAPLDGRGFGGARAVEQAVGVAQAEQEEEDVGRVAVVARAPGRLDPLVEDLGRVRLDGDEVPIAARAHVVPQARVAVGPPAGERVRRPRAQNPFHARPDNVNNGNAGAANAVRRHERAARQHQAQAPARGPRPPAAQPPRAGLVPDEQALRQQAELQRFLHMAMADEEEGWDSDGLDEDDGLFVIR